MSSPLLAIGMAECKLLLRNKTVAVSATLLPLLMGAYLGLMRPGEGAWGVTVALQLMAVLGFTVYFTSCTALTSRREDLYLKRLCSAEPAPVVVLAGLLFPVVVLGIVQSAVMLAIAAALGAPVVPGLPMIAVAVVGGLLTCLAAGAATSGRTSTAEQAQITTLPFFFLLFGGAVWAAASTSWFALLLPGGAVGYLTGRAMSGDLSGVGPALLSLVVWVAVAAAAARSWFRWEPRG